MAQKKDRELDIFYRLMIGSGVSVKELAAEYEVSAKSISRDISEIKSFLADHRELLSNAEVRFSSADKRYYLELPQFLGSSELFSIVKILIGSRAFSKSKTLEIIGKLKHFTIHRDRQTINNLISKEIYHFNEVRHDCRDVVENLWSLTACIEQHNEISISYYKMNRDYVERRVRPLAITFSEYYFYLIAYQECSLSTWEIRYYRVDRIVNIIKHRVKFEVSNKSAFDEGDLMNKIQLMFPGKGRHIKFEFSGPSVQAILDKLPTAKVVDLKEGKSIVEADVYGKGINMFLLSQGSWVKVLEPKELVEEMKDEIGKMWSRY